MVGFGSNMELNRPDKELYRKANSFVSFDASQLDSSEILRNIQVLADRDVQHGTEGYFSRIVRDACFDIGSQTHSKRPFRLHPHVVEEMKLIKIEDYSRYLFYRYRYDTFPISHEIDSYPPCLQIEPTSICNFRCVFCYQADSDFTKPANGHMGMMSLDTFKRIVDEAEGNVEAVTLASRGEPLLCPQIDQMMKYVKHKFLALKVNTNAWFLDEEKAYLLLEAEPNTLVFSADAASEPLYSQLRVRGNLERVLSNIRRFSEIKKKFYPNSRTITRVSGVKYSESQSMTEMGGLWGSLVDQVSFVDYNPWENVYINPVRSLSLACSDLWRRTFVWFDGSVNPCDVDYKSTLRVGNINSQSISEIWQGQNYQKLRTLHETGARCKLSPCDRCVVV